MKKAFAIFSAMLIALGCFGILSKTTVAAAEDGKFTVDPTLEEGETPLYIMGSIADTFPQYYDNEAKPDPNYNPTRRYPWNETKLIVKKYNDAGEQEGTYGVYFTGVTKEVSNGAGQGIVELLKKEDGTISLGRRDEGKLNVGSGPYGSSISYMTTNTSGEDLEFSASGLANFGSSAIQQALIFDGQGRAVRGSAHGSAFLKAGAEGAAELLIAPMFCYEDGKIVVYVEGETTPDKEWKQKEDAEGNLIFKDKVDENGLPVLDENGEPVKEPDMEETNEDKFLYKEIIWAWYQEKPENVNEVGFLEAGWDPNKWDLCVEKDGGYMCYAIAGSEGKEHLYSSAAQPEFVEAYNELKKAEWIAAGNPAETYASVSEISRSVIDTVRVPAGGYVYTFGYLERSLATNATQLVAMQTDMYLDALEHGRNEGFGVQRAYNFSSSGLKTTDVVVDGKGYRVIENNVVEVQPGVTFKPSQNVIYTGLTKYYSDLNDITSFKASTAACEFYIKVNGETLVMPPLYQSMDDVAADFLVDINKEYGTAVEPAQFKEPFSSGGTFYKEFNGKLDAFEAKYASKWGWLFTYARTESEAAANAISSTQDVDAGGNWTAAIWHCLASAAPKSNWPVSYADFATLNPEMIKQKFLEGAPTWDSYALTVSAELDQAYEVEYRVKNNDNNQEDTIVITYVVTDVYTPFIELNKNGLNVESKKVDGKVVINGGEPIIAAQLLKAYDGKYASDASIKGRDITYKVVLDSETLDFNNPTEGTHKVVAKVVAQSANTYKEDLVRFTVTIRDRTEPVVSVVSGTINVAYGATFDVKAGILAASDNVDGNLMLAAHTWCADISATPVNTSKPGTYTVTLAIYDSAGNNKEVSYKVKVAEAYPTAKELGEVADIAEENGLLIAELQEALDGILAKVNELGAKKGCGKSSAALAIQILSASSLLVLVLRKKH